MNHRHILAALFAAAALPTQAANDLTNPLDTYQGNSQENGNGAAQPVFLTGNPLADPVVPPSGLEVSFLAATFAPAAAFETIFFNNTSAVAPEFPGVKFGGNRTDGTGRNYVRTVETDYYTQDFTASITVRRPALDAGNRRTVFFGLGTGARNSGGANPDSGTLNVAAYLELQNGFGNASRRFANGTSTDGNNSNGQYGFTAMSTVQDNSMRLRMVWNSVTRQQTFSFDYGYDPLNPVFTADQTLPATTVSEAMANQWVNGKRASIFFGGDRSVVFTDLAIDVTQPSTPPTPTGLTVSAVSDGSVSLAWSAYAIPGTTYSVYRSTTTGSFTDPALATGLTATSYNDTTVVNGTTYYYVVTQSNTVAVTPESVFSNQVTATPVAGAVTPSGLIAANSGAGVIFIDWADLLSPFDAYNIYRATDAGGPFTLLANTGTVSQHLDETAAAGTTFYYRVTSTKDAQESDPTAVVSAVSGAVEIFADFNNGTVNTGRGVLPTGTAGTWNNDTGDSSASDKLNDSSGVITSISVTGGSNFGVFGLGTGAHVGGNPATLDAANGFNLMTDYRFTDVATRTYTFSGLVPNRKYDLYLFGYGGDVTQNSAFNVGGIIKQNTDPTGLTTLTEGKHYLTYTAVAEFDGTLSFVWGTPGSLGLIDAQGAGGAGFSGFQLVENANAVLQPTGLSATEDTSGVGLSWLDVDSATSYKVYRSTTRASGYSYLGTNGLNTNYTDTSGTAGVTYYYVVTALIGATESFFSAEVSGVKEPLIADADADGLSDADEALIGTDPGNPADFFVATSSTVTPSGGNYNVSIVINGAPGTYVIERSTTLQMGSWTEIAGSSTAFTWSTGTVLENPLTLSAPALAPAPGGKEFFRAKGVAPAPAN